MVLPEPGGPIRRRPCPPASAISRARLPSDWPRTSARSGIGIPSADAPGGVSPSWLAPRPRSSSSPTLGEAAGDARDRADRTSSTTSVSVSTGRTSTPSTRAASTAADRATATRRTPRRAIAATIGSTPGTGWTSPPSDSSPSMPTPATARPDLLRPEQDADRHRQVERGAGLAQIGRREVDRDPSGRMGEPGVAQRPRTRSRASWRAVSASPTIVNPGRPGGDVDLDPDEAALEAVERCGRDDRQHAADPTEAGSLPRSPAGHPRAHRAVTRMRDPRRGRAPPRRPRRPACRPRGRTGAATRPAPSRPW